MAPPPRKHKSHDAVTGNGEAAPFSKTKLGSFLTGLADMVSGGQLGPVAGAQEAVAGATGDIPVLSDLIGASMLPVTGTANVLSNIFGDPIFPEETRAAQSDIDESIEANRGYSLLGQIGGAVLPGSILSKGGMALTKVPGIVGNVAKEAIKTVPRRIATGTAVGSGEGALYNVGREESAAAGAKGGAIGGAAGSAILGEALPWVFRAVTGSGSKTAARQAARKEMTLGDKEFPMAKAQEDAARLGPQATLADVNPEAKTLYGSLLESPHRSEQLYPSAEGMRARAGGSAMDEFMSVVNDAAPSTFKREAGDIDTARAGDVAKRNAKQYYQSLEKDFEAAIEGADMTFDPEQVAPAITRLTAGELPLPSQAATADKVNRIIESQTRDNVISPRGMHNIRKGLDQEISAEYAAEAPNYDNIRRMAQAREFISEQLDTIPGFAEVNRKYATEASYMRAFEMGKKMLREGDKMPTAEEIGNVMDVMAPGDMHGFLEGASRSMAESLRKSSGDSSTARKIAKNDEIADRLRQVFGEEMGDKIILEANRGLELTATGKELAGRARVGQKGRLKTEQGGINIDQITLMGSIANLVSSAAGLGAAKRVSSGLTDPSKSREFGRLFSVTGNDLDKALGQIDASSPFVLPKTLGGRDMALGEEATNAVTKRLPRSLLTYDVGETPARAGGLMFPATQDAKERGRKKKNVVRKRKNE